MDPVVVAAVVTGVFGLLTTLMRMITNMKKDMIEMAKTLAPIRDNVVNNHLRPEQNLRDQVDRIEFTMKNHEENHSELIQGLSRVEKKINKLQSWSEAENHRMWKEIKEQEEK